DQRARQRVRLEAEPERREAVAETHPPIRDHAGQYDVLIDRGPERAVTEAAREDREAFHLLPRETAHRHRHPHRRAAGLLLVEPPDEGFRRGRRRRWLREPWQLLAETTLHLGLHGLGAD